MGCEWENFVNKMDSQADSEKGINSKIGVNIEQQKWVRKEKGMKSSQYYRDNTQFSIKSTKIAISSQSSSTQKIVEVLGNGNRLLNGMNTDIAVILW